MPTIWIAYIVYIVYTINIYTRIHNMKRKIYVRDLQNS